MDILAGLKNRSKGILTSLKDPFRSKNIESVNLQYSKPLFGNNFTWKARINFTNGGTSGTHRIENDNFDAIVTEVHELIESLSEKK